MNQDNSSPPKRLPEENSVQKTETVYEDEIDLVDYFRVLWKRKRLIVAGTLIPTILAGLLLYFLPRTYQLSYTYNRSLNEKEFSFLEDTFYSQENLDRLAEQLKSADLAETAEAIGAAESRDDLKELIQFEAVPSYWENTASAQNQSAEEMKRFQEVRSNRLMMHLFSKSPETIREFGKVCRHNFEQQVPMFSISDSLRERIAGFNENMATIEEARYRLNLQLERKKSTLAKLKNTTPGTGEALPGDLILQFSDVGSSSAYLPLPYQIQAVETQIINLEEQIRQNQEQYAYYSDLLDLYQTLQEQVESTDPMMTLDAYHGYLTRLAATGLDAESAAGDSLQAYIKRIENRIAGGQPIIENPMITQQARGTVKKTGIVFGIACVLSIFSTFIMEGLQNKINANGCH